MYISQELTSMENNQGFTTKKTTKSATCHNSITEDMVIAYMKSLDDTQKAGLFEKIYDEPEELFKEPENLQLDELPNSDYQIINLVLRKNL
jgi:hypothetical protein